MKKYGIRLLFTMLLLLGGSVWAQGSLTLNLKDADILAVISTVSEMTGKNFIVDPRVKGKVTIVSSEAMDADAVYQVFLSMLGVQGFSVIPVQDNTYKIVPEVSAKQSATPVTSLHDPSLGGESITQVIPIQHVTAAQLVPILRPLIPQQGHMAAYPPTNTLIVSDRADNVARIADIIRRIDKAGDADIEIVTLQHASAAEVVKTLSALNTAKQKGKATSENITVVADERTNSVLLGGDKIERLRIRALVTHLDTPVGREGDTQVIYLRHAEASKLVEVLTGVGQNFEKDQQAKKASRPNQAFNIQADEATNALVITAPPALMRSLQSIIRKLDIRRSQVLVEAVIAEIQGRNEAELGLQWLFGGDEDGDGLVGAINFPTSSRSSIIDVVGNIAADQTTAAASGLGPGASLALGVIDSSELNFASLIQALAGNANTNILSTPSLMTLDNEEAEIVVGQEVATVTGSISRAGELQNPFQTIDRRDVGITLKVTPQISEGGMVKLSIEQEVSSVAAATQGVDLTFDKRNIRTSVLADDGEIIVLGGLIEDQISESVQRVPILSAIPILGKLFTFKSANKSKRNLVVFIHPVIVPSKESAAFIANSKYIDIRTQQLLQRQKGVFMQEQNEVPVLPEIEDYRTKYRKSSPPKPHTPEHQPSDAELPEGQSQLYQSDPLRQKNSATAARSPVANVNEISKVVH
ncbi:MAG TPA: type II secretion system protein GspD [Gammaproteobacteria bacterium]|nr:type II secretion system protein GspD [Gammaproteobacteria bacterium]